MEDLRTGVQFPPAPPITKIPTLIGWDSFCPKLQRWRGFGPWPRERQPPYVPVFCLLPASLLWIFSVCLVSVLGPTSSIGAGFRNDVCVFQLLLQSRTEKAKGVKKPPEGGCREGRQTQPPLKNCIRCASHAAGTARRIMRSSVTPPAVPATQASTISGATRASCAILLACARSISSAAAISVMELNRPSSSSRCQ